MIFSLSIIHDHDRKSSITRVLHNATWDFFISRLPFRFRRSPRVVKEVIMSNINDLVQELTTSSDGAVGASFFEMRRLLKILEACFRFLKVCSDIMSFFLQLLT